MTQRQQYVILPTTPTAEMIESVASFGHTFGYSSQRGTDSVEVFADLLKAAPPPPEQVLSDEEVSAVRTAWHASGSSMSPIGDLIRLAERTVLAKLTEQK